jgi:hypothetical protein
VSFIELSVLKALKIGKVPANGCLRMAVGRDPEIAEFRRILEYVAAGGSEVRFLRGDYGSGKTFVCSLVRELAVEQRFAVSILNLNREVPFGRRDLVLAQILSGLQTPEGGIASGLDDIVQAWLNQFDIATPHDDNLGLREAIKNIGSVDPGLAMALRGYHHALLEDNYVLMEGALAWVRGEAITQEVRSGLKLVGKLTPDQAFKRLRGVLTLLRQAGYLGLVILLDEAESMMRLAAPQRQAAYNAIREIIDTCETEFPGCLFIFAGTQKWFEDEFNGVAQYRALYERIRNTQKDSVRDLRQPIIRLEGLEQNSLMALATRVREMHGIAYDWNALAGFPNREMREYISRVSTRFGNVQQKPRGFLKGLVDVLDARQQGLSEPDAAALEAAFVAVEMDDANLDDIVLAGA